MPERTAPLAGVRVLDLSYVFAVPYVGALLSDMGAEVIKIEAPGRLDLTRGNSFARYLDNDPGDDPWNRSGVFHVLNRGKKSLSLDLNTDKGRELFLALLQETDIVLDNFTPRVLRKWGLQYERLKQLRPGLIMLSNTGYGAGGPWSEFPSQGTTLEATMGITQYTGYRGDKPWKVGQSYPDFLATWTSLLAIMAALSHRDRTGRGQWIDLGMYQVGAALVAEPILQYQRDHSDIPRWGNEDPEHVPSNVYRAQGPDNWVALTVVSDAQWQVLTELMAQPHLARDERFATAAARRSHRDAVNRLLADWVAQCDAKEWVELLQKHGIASGRVMAAHDLMRDPQMRHRGFYEMVSHDPPIADRPLIGRPFVFRRRGLKIRGPAPRFGQHTREVLGQRLGKSDEEIDTLMSEGVVADHPLMAYKGQPWNLEEGLRLKTLVAVDKTYAASFPIQDGPDQAQGPSCPQDGADVSHAPKPSHSL